MAHIISTPSPVMLPGLMQELESYASQEGQVIIHGVCRANEIPIFIRIWPTTYLFDQHSSHISELVHFEKISAFPAWTEVKSHLDFGFTLVFTGLPKSCVSFDLQEVIPQANGFYVASIPRNKTDVYFLDFSD